MEWIKWSHVENGRDFFSSLALSSSWVNFSFSTSAWLSMTGVCYSRRNQLVFDVCPSGRLEGVSQNDSSVTLSSSLSSTLLCLSPLSSAKKSWGEWEMVGDVTRFLITSSSLQNICSWQSTHFYKCLLLSTASSSVPLFWLPAAAFELLMLLLLLRPTSA